MGELSIEEKAKRYDEAIKRAKAMIKVADNQDEYIGFANTIFPELKESEDEKIIKELITHCRNTRCVTEEGAERIAKWIAWLEKQGEKKPADEVLKIRQEVYQSGYNDGYKHGIEDVKQGEQKSIEWSKEDERIYYSLLADIRIKQESSTSTLEAYYNEQISWLKSLKQRIEG